ncbi:hypothetical protein C8J56DRAFT_879607 [Mycena floridula]|nr:hypothetical protein C8J56DRAFT_879607 [Mycena floridula]
MSKTKNAKSRRRKSGMASRQSQHLNPAPDNPNTEQSTSSLAQSMLTPSSNNVAGTANSLGPRYLFTPVIGNHPRMTALVPTLSSLDTLTPSPPVVVDRPPNDTLLSGNNATVRDLTEPYPVNDWRIRHQEVSRLALAAPVGHTSNPIIVENFIGTTDFTPFAPVNVNPDSEQGMVTSNDIAPIPDEDLGLSEQERAHRRAQKMPHHGAMELDDDDVANDIEIQQAILDNTPPIIDPREPSRSTVAPESNPPFSYLPSHPSIQLNELFNQAVNILTSSVTDGVNPNLKTQDSIAAIAGNHFAANLEAAVSNLMLPRMQTESSEAYLTRMNAQQSLL